MSVRQPRPFANPRTDARLADGMIQQDAARIPELKRQIKALEEQMAHLAENSSIASQ